MLRTTLLIVLVFAGSPVASLACGLWCNSPVGASHNRIVECHDAFLSEPKGPQVARDIGGCHVATVTAPFLAAVRQAEFAPFSSMAAVLVDVTPIAPGNGMSAVGSTFDTQPPRPPSSWQILRV